MNESELGKLREKPENSEIFNLEKKFQNEGIKSYSKSFFSSEEIDE